MSTVFEKTNREIISELKEVLAAMEVKNVNRFKIRAYQNAIASIDHLTTSVFDLWENNRLREIPGIGGALEEHLNELFTTGHVKDFSSFKKDLPEGMFALLGLRGIGAKTAYKLASAFQLNDRSSALENIKKAATEGKIRLLEGFGEKSETDILNAVEQTKKNKFEKPRMLLIKADEVAGRIIDYMKQNKEVLTIEVLGSHRRRASTVGDIDLAVTTNEGPSVMEHFINFSEVKEVISHGANFSSVLLKNGEQADLLLVEPEAYGSLLQHFTGSKQHNVLLRSYALESGLSLSQHGIKENGALLKFTDEKAFYKKLGLAYIPPELREGKDEINVARRNKLPDLIESSDIQGDLHTHTTDSDGIDTLEDMVQAAKSLGYKYIGISDHAPSVLSRGKFEVLGLIAAKRKEIEQYNYSHRGIRVLFGYEVNILVDSTLAMPDEFLEKLDYCIASIHTSFDQDRNTITNRLISAVENPHVTIIGHPSGRLINERAACDINWSKFFDAVAANNKVVEINSQPNRLDLADDLIPLALEKGIKFIINTDSHSKDTLNFMHYGIDVARRGWLTRADVINTMDTKDLLKYLNVKA